MLVRSGMLNFALEAVGTAIFGRSSRLHSVPAAKVRQSRHLAVARAGLDAVELVLASKCLPAGTGKVNSPAATASTRACSEIAISFGLVVMVVFSIRVFAK